MRGRHEKRGHRASDRLAARPAGARRRRRPLGWLGALLPLFFVLFAVVAGVLVVSVNRGDGPPVWFVVAWLAGLGWNAYWWLLRVCIEVRVKTSTIEWSAPLRRGAVPLSDVVGIRATRFGRQFAALEVRGRRPLLVPVRVGFGQLERALADRAPQVSIDEA